MKKSLLFLLVILICTRIKQIYNMENNTQLTSDEQINQLENYFGKTLKDNAQKEQLTNEIYVPLWNARSITSTPKRKKQQPLIISAFHLTHIEPNEGGIATALYIRYHNGNQFAGMTHYLDSESNFYNHTEKIKKLCTNAINKQNPRKQITHINFFIIQPIKNLISNNNNNNPYYPNSNIPLEHFPKKLLEPIQPFTTQLFYYNSLRVKNNSTDLKSEDFHTTSKKYFYPIFEIILYRRKAFFSTEDQKIKLP